MNQKKYSFINMFPKCEYDLPIGSIFQVEELTMNPGETIPKHIQKCDEITYVISGRAKVFGDGEYVNIKAGDIHFVRKDAEHSIVLESDKVFRFICIGVKLNPDYACIEEFVKIMKRKRSFVVKDNGDVRILSELLLNEFYTIDDMSKIIIDLYITQIFALICRLYNKNVSTPSENTKFGMRSDYAMYNILRYIDREYMNIKSVKDVAEIFLYNENYLSHIFTNKLGISVKQYIVQKKIMEAEKLLTTTDMSIESIATHLNFNTAHTFYQAFKKYHDVSPLQYRKRYFMQFW